MSRILLDGEGENRRITLVGKEQGTVSVPYDEFLENIIHYYLVAQLIPIVTSDFREIHPSEELKKAALMYILLKSSFRATVALCEEDLQTIARVEKDAQKAIKLEKAKQPSV